MYKRQLTDRTVYNNLEFVLRATGWKNKQEIQDRIEAVSYTHLDVYKRQVLCYNSSQYAVKALTKCAAYYISEEEIEESVSYTHLCAGSLK